MECKCSRFWLGLGLGSLLGAVVCHVCQTPVARLLKRRACHALHAAEDEAEALLETACQKAAEAGAKATGKA